MSGVQEGKNLLGRNLRPTNNQSSWDLQSSNSVLQRYVEIEESCSKSVNRYMISISISHSKSNRDLISFLSISLNILGIQSVISCSQSLIFSSFNLAIWVPSFEFRLGRHYNMKHWDDERIKERTCHGVTYWIFLIS